MAFSDLCAHLEKHMGFALIPDPDLMDRVAHLVEYRNIFVHGAGVIGSVSARRVSGPSGSCWRATSLHNWQLSASPAGT